MLDQSQVGESKSTRLLAFFFSLIYGFPAFSRDCMLSGNKFNPEDLRWHLVQPRYIQYSTYHVKLSFGGKEEVIRHDLAVYGARDTEKVRKQSVHVWQHRSFEPNVPWFEQQSGSYRVFTLCNTPG